jgi:hypothetical protein
MLMNHSNLILRFMIRMDHHCGLLGNCVGVRNHRFFLGFLTAVGVGGLTLVFMDLCLLAQFGAFTSFSAYGRSEVWLSLLLLPILCLGSSFCFLAYFHIGMLCMDVTMKEKYGRQRKQGSGKDMPVREKMQEIYEQIIVAPWALKKGSVALREKQTTRRNHVGGYQQIPQHSDHKPENVSVVVASSGEEEQIGCTGVEAKQQ